MERKESHWVVYGALAANIGVALAKFAAAAVSGSAALVSEGIHSLADCSNELLLLLGLARSQKPADRSHPYGYGKELYFWSLIVALVLFTAGGGASMYNGVERLLHPRAVEVTWVSYAVLLVAAIFEGASLFLGMNKLRAENPGGSVIDALRRSKDPSVFTVVAEDTAALLGLTIAAVGTALTARFHDPRYDAAASIAVGLILGVVATFLVSESRKLLVGESGSRALLDDVRRLTAGDTSVRKVGEALSMQLGADEVLLNLDVEFNREISGDALPRTIQALERKIRAAHPEITRIFLEVSALGPREPQ